MSRSWGIILLAIYLIARGVLTLTNVQIVAATIIVGVLALFSGICLLLGK